MTWVKLDDAMVNHPKIEAVGVVGLGLHTAALCYANHHLTDGFISSARLPLLVNMDDVDRRWEEATAGNDHPSVHWADILVMAGIWDRAEGGYQIHDYHDYQPTRREVLKDREKRKRIRAAAGQQGGKQTASKRAANVRQSDQQMYTPVARSPKPDLSTASSAPGFPIALRAVENAIGLLPPTVMQKLVCELEEGTEPEWVIEAAKESEVHNKRSWAYIEGILDSWREHGFKADTRKKHAAHTRSGQGHPTTTGRSGAVRRTSDFD